MPKKNTSTPRPTANGTSVDDILQQIRALRRRSADTVKKMTELERSIEAVAQRKRDK
jgi:hypothetical protein